MEVVDIGARDFGDLASAEARQDVITGLLIVVDAGTRLFARQMLCAVTVPKDPERVGASRAASRLDCGSWPRATADRICMAISRAWSQVICPCVPIRYQRSRPARPPPMRYLQMYFRRPARQHLDAEPGELVVPGVNGSRGNFDSFDEAFGEARHGVFQRWLLFEDSNHIATTLRGS